MTTKSSPTDLTGRKLHLVRALFLLAVVVLIVAAAGTIVRASGSRSGFTRSDKDRDDNREFQGRNDEDRNDNDRDAYAIGLWGDLPYSDVQAITGVPNMIADMNSQDLEFTAHDGDLKAGNSTTGSVTPTDCSDALYIQALNYFNSLRAPAVFTTRRQRLDGLRPCVEWRVQLARAA